MTHHNVAPLTHKRETSRTWHQLSTLTFSCSAMLNSGTHPRSPPVLNPLDFVYPTALIPLDAFGNIEPATTLIK